MFPEKASSTFKKGALCFVNAGFLDECGADPSLMMGIATADGSNNAADGGVNNIVELAHPDTLFRGYVDTSASEGTGTTATTDLGKGYGFTKSATGGIWYVDKNKTTTSNRVSIWEFWSEAGYAVGDVRTHVLFSFTQFRIASFNTAFQGSVGA
jgi:hypothetical protein